MGTDYEKLKTQNDERVRAALAARQSRQSSGLNALDDATQKTLKSGNKWSSQVQSALREREHRVQSGIENTLAEIQTALNKELEVYKVAVPIYGDVSGTVRSQTNSRANLAKLREKVEAYRRYIPNADDVISVLDQMRQGYDEKVQVANSPVFNRTTEAKTITPTAALPGQSTPGMRGVDTDYMSRRINMTAGAAAGYDIPVGETEELPEVERTSPVVRWLKNVGIAGSAGYFGDMTSGVAAGRSGNTAGKEFVSGALQTYIDQQEREKRFVEAYEAGDTSISKEDYEIAKEQIEFLQFYIDMYSAANKVEQESGELTHGVANDLYTTADANLQSAMSGQKKVGQLLTQASVVGVQMLMDMALGGGLSAGTGMTAKQGAKAVMLGRVFGSGATAAANNGGDATAQIANGTLYAAMAYLTEALSGGNPAYDTGSGLINKFAKSLGASKAVQLYLSSLPAQVFSEGLEEMLESVLNPLADRITTGAAYQLDPQQVISDGIIGMIVGAGGQTVSAAVRAAGAAVNDHTVGQAIIESGNVDALRDAAGMAGIEFGDISTPLEVGKAFRRVQDGFLNQAVQERIVQLGGQPDSVLGSAVIALSRDEGLSKDQRNAYYGSTAADQVIGELKSAAEGTRTTGNSWVWEAYVRPSELGNYRAVADGAAQEMILTETVSNTPESETNARETAQTAPEAAEVPAPAEQISPVTETAQNIMERELAAVTNTQGMTDQEAKFHFGEEFRRITHSMYESAKGSETEQDAYIRLKELMDQAAAQGGGDIKAIMAYLKGAVSNERTSVLPESVGRQDGESSAFESGSMDGGPGADQAGGGTGQRAAVDAGGGSGSRIAAAKGLRLGLQSSVSQGIANGTDNRSTLFLPVYGMDKSVDAFIDGDEELRAIQADADKNGITVHFFGDLMEMSGRSGRTFLVDGYADGNGEVWVCFNSAEQSAMQIYNHEKIHDAIAIDGGSGGELFNAMWDAVEANVSPEELRAISGRTMLEYRDAYDPKDIDKIHEEIICNAYAEMKDFQNKSYADSSQVVRDVFLERTGERPVQLGAKGTNSPPGDRYTINENIYNELNRWYNSTTPDQRLTSSRSFKLGTTSEALKSIGVKDGAVYMRGHKIQSILEKHSEMTLDEIKAIPEILENPVLVMKSATVDGSIVVINEKATQDGRKVFVAIALAPKKIGANADDFIVVTSAYGRTDSNIKNLITGDSGRPGSEMLYVTEDVNRAEALLNLLGVQFPSGRVALGPIGNISYADDGVKIQGVLYSDWSKGVTERFNGIELKSNYPDLTAYDRYLTAQEQKRDFTDLQTSETDDNMEKRISRALELARQRKTESQIAGETGLVTMMNGDLRDGFTGPIVWRNTDGRSKRRDRYASDVEVKGHAQGRIPANDGRGDGKRFPGTDRQGSGQAGRRRGWDELHVGEQVKARRLILEQADRNRTWEQEELRREYGSDDEFAEAVYEKYRQGITVLENWSPFLGDVSTLIKDLDALGLTETVKESYSAAEDQRRDFEGARFENYEKRIRARQAAREREQRDIREEWENQELRREQVHNMLDEALLPVLEYSHAKEGTEDYIRALMQDPTGGKRPDRRVAERYAERIGMPVIEGHRAVPFWSWVRAMDRGNYGLVIGPGDGMGEVNVLFWNKASGNEYVKSMVTDEVEIVPASYADRNEAENTQSLFGSEREAPEGVYEPEEELPFTDADFQRWADEAERETELMRRGLREQDVQAEKVIRGVLGKAMPETIVNFSEENPLTLESVKNLLNTYEDELLLMEPQDAEAIYEFAKLMAPGRGGNYNKDLSRNLDEAAENKALSKEKRQELRAFLQKFFEEPLWKAKDQHSRQVHRRINDLYDTVVKGLGIKKGSRESAAVQWYGEGVKQGKYSNLPPSETKEYTLEDLKRDFPTKWKNIVKAERYFRQVYDEYVTRINQSLEKIYPKVEQRARERIEHYRATASYYNKRVAIEDRKAGTIKDKIRALEQKLQKTAEGSIEREDAQTRLEHSRRRMEQIETKCDRLKVRGSRALTVAANLENEIRSGGILRNKRLQPRKDYFHHFQEMDQGFKALWNIITTPQDISSNLAGISENTKPKSKWAGFLQKRQGAIMNADAVGGLLRYIPAAEYKINIDPVIARGRMQIKLMANATQESRNANRFLTWYTDYINDLAGKTNPIDRVPQKLIGRRGLALMKWLNGRVRSNAIMGNLRSAMSQFFNLPNATGYIKNPLDWTRGAGLYTEYLFKGKSAKAVLDRSAFLRERYLDDELLKFDKSFWSVPKKTAGWFLSVGDKISGRLMWCAAYEKGVRTRHNDPIQYADDITRRSTAGRGIGETPLVQTAEVTKLIAPFQVEVNNAWQLMKERVRTKDAVVLFNIWATTFLMNEILEMITGNRVGFDPIDVIRDAIKDWDDEEPVGEQVMNILTRLGGEALSNAPFGTQLAAYLVPNEADREAMFGEADPTRFGTGNIGLNMLLEPVIDWVAGDNVIPAALSMFLNIGMPYGGKQTERVIETAQAHGLLPYVSWKRGEGMGMYSQESGRASYTDNGNLRFVEEKNLKNLIVSGIFGTFSTKAGKQYIDEDTVPLNSEKTELFQELTGMGASTTVAYAAVTGIGSILPDKVRPDGSIVYGQDGYNEEEAKDWETVDGSREWNTIDYIEGLDMEDEARELLYTELVASDGRLDDLASFEAAMMTWPQKMDAVKKYLELYMNSDMTAVEKATELKAWAEINFSSNQAAVIEDNMTFSTGWKAEAETYNKLTDGGLSAESALSLTEAWADLEPESGKTQVSELQKMNEIIRTVSSPQEQMSALSSMLDDAGRWKLSRAASADLTAKDYVEFKTILEEYKSYDPEGSANSLSQAECTAALKSMGWLNLNQKAVLWQLQTMAKDGKSNPFSTLVGLDVYNGYMEWKESGEEVKVETTEDTEPVQMMGYYPGLQLPVL